MLVKVLVTLALILLANRLVKELLVSVLAGTLLLGLWFGHGLPAVGVSLGSASARRTTCS